jgi:hemerythrin-like domain-containing protein
MQHPTERVDTWEMVMVHRLFRREFRLLPGLIRDVADGDRQRADVVGDHLTNLSDGLHHHHEGEDELLWPVLVHRVGLRADLVHRMEGQHARLQALLDEIGGVNPRWRATATTADRDRLADLAAQASAALDEHLADEETELLPLVEEYVTPAEWHALNQRAQRTLPKNAKILVFLGAILEEATDREAAMFMRQLPWPVRLIWRLAGRRAYSRALARVRGTDRSPQPSPSRG